MVQTDEELRAKTQTSQKVFIQEKCNVEGCNNLQEWKGIQRRDDDRRIYRQICTTHRKYPQKFKKVICENISCQWNGKYENYILQVDHIDGNNAHILESNFQTLCANCHTTKSFQNGDTISKSNKQIMSNRLKSARGRMICVTKNCPNLRNYKEKNPNTGVKYYHGYCKKCKILRRLGYSKKEYCEKISCQWNGKYENYILQVDHIDGNNKNNAATNFQTLCTNCHWIKHYEERTIKL